MFTHYALPIDRFIPAPTRRRRLTALLVAAFAASALALGGGASTASAAPSWVTLDTPYANDRAEAFVYCSKPYTPYWFASRGRAWLRSPTGWRLAETRLSSNVIRYC